MRDFAFRVANRRVVLSGLGVSFLAACQSRVQPGMQAPIETSSDSYSGGATDFPANLPQAQGEVLGNGPVRIALLLPLSAAGNSAKIAREFRNAAELAMQDIGPDVIELVIKDCGESEAQAQAAASQAVQEGASLLLGPIFAQSVSAAAGVARQAGRIMIAFSSDQNVAGRDVYLNSFLPEGVTSRIMTYAAQNNLRQVVGFFANGQAGDLAERAARAALQSAGGSLSLSVRYDFNEASIAQATASAVSSLSQAQGLFIPDGGAAPNAIIGTLRSNGAQLQNIRLLGTGQWSSSNLGDPALKGAWFADGDHQRLAQYTSRYQAKFGEKPTPGSTLCYDSVVMTGSIVKRFGASGLNSSIIENSAGYAGYAGVFRFRSDGTTQRFYSIYEVEEAGATKLINAAPTSFSGS